MLIGACTPTRCAGFLVKFMFIGQSFCPLLPGETLDPFAPIDTNATDVGAATINGKTVEHFEWSDYDKVGLAASLPGYATELFI